MAGLLIIHIIWPLYHNYDNLPRAPLLESQIMPELPEIETVCRGLDPILKNKILAEVILRRSSLRYPLPSAFGERLTSRRVISVNRRAKFILIELDNDWVLIIHLGMSGRLVIHPDKPPTVGPHDHIDFITDSGVTVRYNDVRRFGFMDLIHTKDITRHRHFEKLGPEPLGNSFDATTLETSLTNLQTPIKTALLNQQIIAGLGNIYVCESLFQASISPRRQAKSVTGIRANRLTSSIRSVLMEAIEAGGTSLRDYVQTNGELGYFQTKLRAYNKEGHPCVMPTCTGTIRRIKQAGRSTFYCPKHQR